MMPHSQLFGARSMSLLSTRFAIWVPSYELNKGALAKISRLSKTGGDHVRRDTSRAQPSAHCR